MVEVEYIISSINDYDINLNFTHVRGHCVLTNLDLIWLFWHIIFASYQF